MEGVMPARRWLCAVAICTVGCGGSTPTASSGPLAGTFAYHCDFHPAMTGTIVVTP